MIQSNVCILDIVCHHIRYQYEENLLNLGISVIVLIGY